MLRVGIAGLGFMGRVHYTNWTKCKDAEVAAICDINPNIVEDSKKAAGNIAGAAQEIDFDKLKVYSDYEKMLSDGVVDAVSITLPTYMHRDFTVKALEAGVHVLCEKPMALDADQCRQMAEAAEKSGKVLQIGHCIRFWPEYAKTKEIIDSGEYGDVISAVFRRLGAAPTWGAEDWFAQEDRSGGVALDLHIHDADYIQYLFGMPESVRSFGYPASGKGLRHISTGYNFGDDKLVTAEGSWAISPTFGFEMSFNIIMEKATIVFDCTRDPAFKVCPNEGEVFTPETADGDGYQHEIEHFAAVVAGRDVPKIITPSQSINSIKLVKAEVESVKSKSDITV